MSQPWEPQARPAGGGSVRRARERMEAGLPPDMPPPPQRAYDPPRAAPNQAGNRSRPQMPQALASSRNGQGPIGVAISRPTQVPQWPLSGTIEGTDTQNNQQYQPPQGRGMAPQRPPRPSRVPSILDSSKVQDHTPSFQYKPQQSPPDQSQWKGAVPEDEEMASPSAMSPMTQSSRPSTVSSVGTIPDFPVPVLAPPRRSVHLGPPPSARRGASSYYSQASYVSPIPEESPRVPTAHGSYASSAAIPSSWGSEYDEDETLELDLAEEGRESRESNADDSDDRGLIRSASLGKRAKPSMITTRGSEKTDATRPSPRPQQSLRPEQTGAAEGAATSGKRDDQRGAERAVGGNADSRLADGTGWIDTSTSSSDSTVPTIGRAVAVESPSPKSSSPSDEKSKEMLAAYSSASTLQPQRPTPTRTPSPANYKRLTAMRRPPRLDIDAVRDAEARGSLTSLPDLIRRATTLAAMMDRGKRPGSRLHDLNDFPLGNGDDKAYSSLSPDEKRRSGLSGMLAAFPPPGVATPRDDEPRPQSVWPTSFETYDSNSKSKRASKKRRCCGLPCWGIMLILLILLIIIAAAVVVPIELLVVHKQKSPPTLSAVQKCQADEATTCQNGGASLMVNDACSCVCTNGFTGSTCTVGSASGCTMTTLPELQFANVTLGDSLPRLITTAQSNFSIPLSTQLLGRLSSSQLSCSSENALVTFDGQSQEAGNPNDIVTATVTGSLSTPSAIPNSNSRRRRGHQYHNGATETDASEPPSTTSILVDTSYPSSTMVAPAVASSTAPTEAFHVTEEAVDFARVVVLFVLQEKKLDNAVNAQLALQKFFDLQSYTNKAAMNVSLGDGNSANLINFSIDVGSGVVGGSNSTSKTNGAMQGRKRNLWAAL